MRLKDKVAIITGGARGIGKAIAALFAGEGAKVVIVARTQDEVEETVNGIRGNGGIALGLAGDVSSILSVEQVVDETMRNFSTIDILVNSAAVQSPIGPFVNTDIKEWIRNFEINFFGTAMFCKAVLPVMMEKRKGWIINLSGGGSTSPRPFFCAYGVSKTAVVRFTETLADEVRDFNIQVNAIAPGAVNTRMLDEVINAGEFAGETEMKEARSRKEQGGTPPQVPARLALFLASEKSDGITGRLLSAPWDSWEDGLFIERLKSDPDLATLRRIDEKSFFRKVQVEASPEGRK